MLELLIALVVSSTTATASVAASSTEAAVLEDIFVEEAPASLEEPSGDPIRARMSMRFEGRLSVDTQLDQEREHVGELGLGARLEMEIDLSDRVSAYAAPNIYWVGAIDRDGGDRQAVFLNTPEARVSVAFDRFDLRAGALIFNWGSSDLVGPADILNPLDYRRNFVAAIEDAKIPVIAAELAGHFGPVTIRGVVQPFFTAPRFFLGGWDTALIQSQLSRGIDIPRIEQVLGKETIDEIGDKLLITDRPADRIDQGTFAARATLHVDDLDLSLTAVHGWEPLPEVRVHPDLVIVGGRLLDAFANKAPVNLDGEAFAALGRLQEDLARGEEAFLGAYRRRNLLGADATLAVDPVILKLDVAYSFRRTAYTQDYVPVAHPWLTAVAGVEYFDGDALQVIVEAFALTIFDIKSNYRLSLFEEPAPPPSTTTDAGRRTIAIPGLAGVVRYSAFDGDLSFELAAISTLTRGDVLLVPAARWRIDDAQQLSLSATFIEGKSDGYGGVYTHNDQISLSYAYTH